MEKNIYCFQCDEVTLHLKENIGQRCQKCGNVKNNGVTLGDYNQNLKELLEKLKSEN